MRMSALLPVTASPPGGPAQRAGGELGGEMALVVGRPALVGDRVAMLGGDPAGFDKGFLGGRLAAQVRLGLGRGELLPADRAAVPDDRVGDHPLGVTQDRKVLAHQRRGEQLRVADERAEAQLIAVDANERQLAQVVDVDQDLGLCQAQLHHRDQAVPARDDPGLGSELGKQGEGVFDAGRPLVRELRWDLHPCSRGSRQLPKQPVYYGTSYRTARRSGKHRRHYRRHYGGNVPVSVDELPGRFRAALPPAVDARRADEVRADLLARWSEPHRHYHTLDHLAAVLSIVDITGPVALAAWFHDAVFGEMYSWRASSALVSPSASSIATSRSRGVNAAAPSAWAATPRGGRPTRPRNASTSATRQPDQRASACAAAVTCVRASSSRPSAIRQRAAPAWAVPRAAGGSSAASAAAR